VHTYLCQAAVPLVAEVAIGVVADHAGSVRPLGPLQKAWAAAAGACHWPLQQQQHTPGSLPLTLGRGALLVKDGAAAVPFVHHAQRDVEKETVPLGFVVGAA